MQNRSSPEKVVSPEILCIQIIYLKRQQSYSMLSIKILNILLV